MQSYVLRSGLVAILLLERVDMAEEASEAPATLESLHQSLEGARGGGSGDREGTGALGAGGPDARPMQRAGKVRRFVATMAIQDWHRLGPSCQTTSGFGT